MSVLQITTQERRNMANMAPTLDIATRDKYVESPLGQRVAQIVYAFNYKINGVIEDPEKSRDLLTQLTDRLSQKDQLIALLLKADAGELHRKTEYQIVTYELRDPSVKSLNDTYFGNRERANDFALNMHEEVSEFLQSKAPNPLEKYVKGGTLLTSNGDTDSYIRENRVLYQKMCANIKDCLLEHLNALIDAGENGENLEAMFELREQLENFKDPLICFGVQDLGYFPPPPGERSSKDIIQLGSRIEDSKRACRMAHERMANGEKPEDSEEEYIRHATMKYQVEYLLADLYRRQHALSKRVLSSGHKPGEVPVIKPEWQECFEVFNNDILPKAKVVRADSKGKLKEFFDALPGLDDSDLAILKSYIDNLEILDTFKKYRLLDDDGKKIAYDYFTTRVSEIAELVAEARSLCQSSDSLDSKKLPEYAALIDRALDQLKRSLKGNGNIQTDDAVIEGLTHQVPEIRALISGDHYGFSVTDAISRMLAANSINSRIPALDDSIAAELEEALDPDNLTELAATLRKHGANNDQEIRQAIHTSKEAADTTLLSANEDFVSLLMELLNSKKPITSVDGGDELLALVTPGSDLISVNEKAIAEISRRTFVRVVMALTHLLFSRIDDPNNLTPENRQEIGQFVHFIHHSDHLWNVLKKTVETNGFDSSSAIFYL
ncbi:hypothetical protein JKY72_06190 [Candidatus Gracilibacteria bacterium]|nr:hypothetical protein [Candidatus Gracilibacteria bacterium]